MSTDSEKVKVFYVTDSRKLPKPIGVIQDPISLQGLGEIDMKDYGWDGVTTNWFYDLKTGASLFYPLMIFSDAACTKPLCLVADAPGNCLIRVKNAIGWDSTGHFTLDKLY